MAGKTRGHAGNAEESRRNEEKIGWQKIARIHMRKAFTIGLFVFAAIKGSAQLTNQKILSEAVLEYSVELLPPGNPDKLKVPALLSGATQKVWIKGRLVRVDFISSLRRQSLFYNGIEKTGIVLKESGSEQYLTRLDAEEWLDYFDAGVSANPIFTEEIRLIDGLLCKKALIQRPDSSTLTLFYTEQYLPFTKGYDPAFSQINGLPVLYSYVTGGYQVTFSLKKVETIPISASMFEEPKTSYKLLEYKAKKATTKKD